MCAQSNLPSTAPTALPAASPHMNAAPAADTARRPVVVYSGGQLEITADNSSLNQILHEISRATGMKITGGVTDERVYGKYGPGAPSEIIERLLDGTGSNMLLRETAAKVPAELILTAREGGPTPPNPNARGFNDDTPEREEEPQQAPPPQVVPPAFAGGAGSAPPPGPPSPEVYKAPALTTGGENPGLTPAPTPQQIFEQLQRLQQAQPQPTNKP